MESQDAQVDEVIREDLEGPGERENQEETAGQDVGDQEALGDHVADQESQARSTCILTMAKSIKS